MNLNVFMGRLANDPYFFTSKNGTDICNCLLAVNRPTKDQKADFIPLTFYNKLAKLAKNFTKGQRILVNGRLQIDSYKDQNDKTQYKTSIIISSFEYADSKKTTYDNSNNSFGDGFD